MSIESSAESIATLYKYKPLSGKTENGIDEYTFQMLKEGQIYCAKPRSFNDPFDIKIDYYTEDTSFYRKNFIAEKRDGAENLMNIFCLSKNPNSILMWSHYADNHTGICIGFKAYRFGENLYMKAKPKYIQNALGVHFMPVLDVIYRNVKPPPVNLDKVNPEAFEAFIITKSSQWEYEDEARIVLTNDKLLKNPVCVSHEEISEIIFGLNTPENLEKEVINIVNNYPDGGSKVKIYKSVMVKGKYELGKELY